MQFNKVNIPKLARNRYDYVAQGSGGGTTIVSGSSGGDNSISRLIEPIYSDEGEICGIRALYSVAVQGGITTYREGEGINLPSIYDGMPIDNITLYWDNGVLKSKGTDGMDEGKLKTYLDTNVYINNANKANYLPSWALATNKPAYTWGEVNNKPAWIGSDKPVYAWTEIGNKPSWIGANKPSYVWGEIGGKPSWIGDNKPSYTFSEIGGKPTTLSGYGITDAVTLNTSQTITAAKNFTGGFAVNGCAIVYDAVNKAWKLTGNLLVTGGITAYGDILTGSAILDALPVDSTLSKEGGVLSVVGGGFLSSITVKLGTVAYDSANGVVSLPSYPTTLPASDVSAWAKAVSKPTYTWGEIGGKPTTLSGYGITDAVLSTDSRLTNSRPASDVSAWAKATTKPSYVWSEIGSKPSTFTPSAHSHAISDITNISSASVSYANSAGNANTLNGRNTDNLAWQIPNGLSNTNLNNFAIDHPNAFGMVTGANDTSYPNSNGGWHFIYQSSYNTAGQTGNLWKSQIAVKADSSAMFVRSRNGGDDKNTNWKGWYEVLTSATYNNYAPTKTGGGASGTWSINITGNASGNAASATKLQTARSINGTNFDGTGNIVTSYWGAARSFSIVSSNGSGASSAVSVNGSGNVSLYLPSTITASLSGNATTATTLQTARTIFGQSFRGDGNVSGTLSGVADINMSGAVKSSYNGSYGYSVANLYNPAIAAFGISTIVAPGTNYARNILTWRDAVNNQGYTTSYTMASYRGAYQWGQMILSVSNNDAGTSTGATLNIHGNGTVTIEGNLLVTGAISQYGTGAPGSGISYVDLISDQNISGNKSFADIIYIDHNIRTRGGNIGGFLRDNGGGILSYFGNGTDIYMGDNDINNLFITTTGESGRAFTINRGKVGIKTQNPSYDLHVVGNGYATGGFSSGSDMRRKTVIQFITRLTLDQIANAPLFDYYWKDLNDGAHTGTSAQYWQNILPNTVRDNGINGLALDYNGVNIAGLITVSREIVKLKRENEELRQEINKLKERAA